MQIMKLVCSLQTVKLFDSKLLIQRVYNFSFIVLLIIDSCAIFTAELFISDFLSKGFFHQILLHCYITGCDVRENFITLLGYLQSLPNFAFILFGKIFNLINFEELLQNFNFKNTHLNPFEHFSFELIQLQFSLSSCL